MLGRRIERFYPAAGENDRADDALLEVSDLAAPPRLKNASITVRRGEILGVGGLQGQGQLRLFLALFGASKSTGEIKMGGRTLRLRRPVDALRAGIALIPEDRQQKDCASHSVFATTSFSAAWIRCRRSG